MKNNRGNAGGNIPDELAAQRSEWSTLSERANRICQRISR